MKKVGAIYSPVVIFAYNRPEHLKKTLECLTYNVLASESDVYVFIDGPKNPEGISINNKVYETAEAFKNGYFKQLSIIHHTENYGLGKSIINGVSEIINMYGKVIVVEDDVLTSDSFLIYMNEALNYYNTNRKIWSVGGYTVPLSSSTDGDVFFVQRCSSYCWGTWVDRWNKIDWDVKNYNAFHFNLFRRKGFNRFGNDRASMLDDQMNGRVNSWAIRFDYAMWENGMYNVLPVKSLSTNIGHDGSGTHSESNTIIDRLSINQEDLNKKKKFDFIEFTLNYRLIKEYCRYFDMPISNRIMRFMSNVVYPYKKILEIKA